MVFAQLLVSRIDDVMCEPCLLRSCSDRRTGRQVLQEMGCRPNEPAWSKATIDFGCPMALDAHKIEKLLRDRLQASDVVSCPALRQAGLSY